MSSRKTILLLIAGLVGIATIFIARSLMTPNGAGPTATPAPVITEVLAAAHDMPTGTIVKELDLKWIPWTADAAQSGKFYLKDKTNMSDLNGAVLREGVRSDEPIEMGRVVQPHEQGFMAAILTPGKRAMAVSLTPSAGVAGFIFPGDHVDVILTHTFSHQTSANSASERYVSETLLNDVRVLALDQRSDNQSTDPKVAQLATLEVTERQAEKLALAANIVGQNGSGHAALSLVLRSLALPDAIETPQNNGGTTWDSDISLAYPPLDDNTEIHKVQVMRGKDTTEASFQSTRSHN